MILFWENINIVCRNLAIPEINSLEFNTSESLLFQHNQYILYFLTKYELQINNNKNLASKGECVFNCSFILEWLS